jgi:hypothetical protein
MQIKGFVFGMAVASLGWLAWSAVGELAMPATAGVQQSGWQSLQPAAGVSRQDPAMCPYAGRMAPRADSQFSERRQPHEIPARCPYSGRTMPHADGQVGDWPVARGQQVPLEI